MPTQTKTEPCAQAQDKRGITKQRQNKQDWAGPWHYPAILRTFPLIETQHNEVQNSKYR